MNVIEAHLKKAIKLKNLEGSIFTFLKSIEETLLNLNKEQLLSGETSKSRSLFNKKSNSTVYSITTEKLSKGRKRAGTHYTLKDTGSFFKGFYLERKSDSLFLSSKDLKNELLIDSFDDIFGLTPKNLNQIIQNKVKPFLINHIKNALTS